MTDADPEPLTKVHVPLLANPHTGGEALWAKDLGDDLFELRNVPFYAYGLNFYDVVLAVSPAPDQKPSVLQVVKRGGHRTLWVTFTDQRSSAERGELLKELNVWKAYYEGADGTYFAIDVEPGGDYAAVTSRLSSWQALGLLEFHSGEEGGFQPRQSLAN
jgi:Domain of unknown function (DUF4265)